MATYEEIKDLPNHPDIYLIDVRTENELAETGRIPTSINIPLIDLLGALTSTEEDFKTAYGRDKPTKDSEIIFTCRSGRRVLEAEEITKNAGFTKVRIYSGSWLEWAEKEGLNAKPVEISSTQKSDCCKSEDTSCEGTTAESDDSVRQDNADES